MGSNRDSVSEKTTKIVNEHRAKIVRRTLSARTGLYRLEPNFVRWEVSGNVNSQSDIIWVRPDFLRWDQTLSVGRSVETCFPSKVLPFLPKFDS
jgi:hypothetical protein